MRVAKIATREDVLAAKALEIAAWERQEAARKRAKKARRLAKSWTARRYARLVADGLCAMCGKAKATGGRTTCGGCREYAKRYRKAMRAVAKRRTNDVR
ncbi:MAG: hypothetical protein ACHREM_19220 [Polyangiales bacterium]